MPYNPGSFTGAAQLPQQDSPYKDLMQSLMQGYKAGSEVANAPEQQRIANALKEAQTQKMTSDASLGALRGSSGIGKDMLSIKLIEQQYGENSPEANEARERVQLQDQGQRSLIANRDIQTQTAKTRAGSPLSKLIAEKEAIDDRPDLSPEQKEEMHDNYTRQIRKATSNPAIEKQAIMGENVDLTIAALEPKIKALTQYAGISGAFKKHLDQGLASIDQAPQEYKDFQEAVTVSTMLAKQLRVQYQDSIQPAALEKIDALVNPANMMNNPEIAENNIREALRIIKQETQTLQKAVGRGKKESKQKTLVFDPATGGFR